MLDKLLDVGHVRSTTGAFWFYILSVVLLVGISTTLVNFLGMVGAVESVGTFFGGSSITVLVGSVFTMLLSGMILSHRKLTSDIFAVLLTVLAVYLSYTVDVTLGLIPVAIMTTIKK